jgi:hypothetical protein
LHLSCHNPTGSYPGIVTLALLMIHNLHSFPPYKELVLGRKAAQVLVISVKTPI